MASRFVADVGGTNIRLAVWQNGQLENIKKYLCRDFENIHSAIRAYFTDSPDYTFEAGCLAVAGPVWDDKVNMTNIGWSFSASSLNHSLDLKWLGVINDFNAVAHSLPVLCIHQKQQVGRGTPKDRGNIAVFGPGTGLGVDHLTWTDSGWQSLDGEGGHVDFAPVDETDVVIWRYLVSSQGRASAEEVLSGKGLLNIYYALCEHFNVEKHFSAPAQISANALNNSCAICEQALQQFCRILGSFAGNLAINLAATGGVYIGGGIVPRFIEHLQKSDFRARFEAKGVMRDYVIDIPTYIITEPDHGLIGAAAYLQQHFQG